MLRKKLIKIDSSKCNNCHSCITVCPVKICINGSGARISIIEDRCIGCGRCIGACKKKALSIDGDDTIEFFDDLNSGVDMTLLMDPAAFASFDDVFKLNGFLYGLGVKAIFDGAFGVELSARSLHEYSKKIRPSFIISPMCASIVNYCEIYEPDLLKTLAPIQSPIMHSAIMVRKFFPQYSGTKIAAITPCDARKSEFLENEIISYNVTILGLKEYFAHNNIDIKSCEPYDFVGPIAERGAGFSSPGGFTETLCRDAPELETKIRHIEGTESIRKYLQDIPKLLKLKQAPFLIDCLSCTKGCNAGTGTNNYRELIDVFESKINKRKTENIRKLKTAFGKSKINSTINKYWVEGIYDRSYVDRSEFLKTYITPAKTARAKIYKSMGIENLGDDINVNCRACGYGSCAAMAEAIYNGLNQPENCYQYLKKNAKHPFIKDQKKMDEIFKMLKTFVTKNSVKEFGVEYVNETIYYKKSGNNVLTTFSCKSRLKTDETSKQTIIKDLNALKEKFKEIGVLKINVNSNKDDGLQIIWTMPCE
ncbi:MAG: hypothetical protein Ta2G_03370 [Termitinemataceae bacterium]|nr:MAG: hypothetical protein Ta2G_03370 [Termitinemataceae bacterium]